MGTTEDPLRAYLRRPTRRRLARVVRAYHEFVWGVALRLTGNPEDAADICQDVFLKLLLHPPAAGQVLSPRGYLIWCVAGEASHLRRTACRRVEREREAARRATENGIPVEDRDALYAAIDELPEDLRIAIDLRYLAGMSLREAAAALDISERAVLGRLERAREALKRRLAPLGLVATGVAAMLERHTMPGFDAPPPPELVHNLLRIVRMGSSIAAPAGAALVGGAVMAKKIAIIVVVLAGVAATFWGGMAITGRDGRSPDDEAVAVAPAPTAATPAHQAGAEKSIAESAADPSEPRRASLQGLVLDEDNEPIEGAIVTITDDFNEQELGKLRKRGYADVHPGDRRVTVQTDARGRYEFEGLASGPAILSVRKETFFDSHRGILELEPGEPGWNLCRLSLARRLTGRILDTEGRPIPDAFVLLNRLWIGDLQLGPGDPVPFPANGEGFYDTGPRMRDAWGRLGASAMAPGYAATSGETAFVGNEARLDFTLEPEMPITVRVTDPTGVPLEGAEVDLGDERSFPRLYEFPFPFATTDGDGRARIEHLPHERFRMYASKEGFVVASFTVEPGGPGGIEVTLSPVTGSVRVRVRVTCADPLPEAILRDLRPELSRETDAGRFDVCPSPGPRLEEGAFVFRPIEPGRYKVILRGSMGHAIGETEPFDHDGSHDIDLEARLDARLSTGIVVSAETGEPVPGESVRVSLLRGDWQVSPWRDYLVLGAAFPVFELTSAYSIAADNQGRFSTLFPSTGFGSAMFRAGSRKRGWSDDVTIDLPAREVPEIRLVLYKGGAIEGQVIGIDGLPAEGELVAAFDARGILAWAYSTGDGRYRIDRLRPGEYAVEPLGRRQRAEGYGQGGFGDWEDLPPPDKFFDRPVVVRNGEMTSLNIDLRRDSLGIIEGDVDQSLPPDRDVWYGMIVNGLPRGVAGLGGWFCASGRSFRIEFLRAGRYRVWYEDQGRRAEADVDVRRSDVARVVLRPPSAALALPIRSESAGPFEDIRIVACERRTGPSARGEWIWETWRGFEVSRSPDGLRIEGLPPGLVRVCVIAWGHRGLWSEPVGLREGTETPGSPLALVPGRSIRLRIERSDGGPIPETIRICVRGVADNLPQVYSERRVSGEPVWNLSGFPGGAYRITATAQGGLVGESAVEVEQDRDAEVSIDLKPR